MPTTFDELYRIYCYPYGKWLWIGWIESKKIPLTLPYFDNSPTICMYPEHWIDYVTFGFTKHSVMNKLRKRYEKLKNLH